MLQVYTGDGKGKTTAAIGLALRMIGSGGRVFLIQFAKDGGSSELKSLRRFPALYDEYICGRKGWLSSNPIESSLVRNGLAKARDVLRNGEHRMLILDEANIVVSKGVIELSELMEAISKNPCGIEIIVTGRDAPEELLEKADLVTKMSGIKHYYNAGVKARAGIEF